MSHAHSLDHFLCEHFPDIEHPKYQSTLEIIGFLTVTAMLASALSLGLLLLVHAL
jgi:hypothetical protein